jgi:hypothetical protein
MNSLNFGNVRSMIMPLLQNKYVLYAMLFISLMNIIGYLAVKNFDAIAFFVLVALLTVYFSRNMIIILFICIITTNFYIGGRGVIAASAAKKEGLKNKATKGNDNADEEEDAEANVDADTEPATNMKDDSKSKHVVEKATGMKEPSNKNVAPKKDDKKTGGMKEPKTKQKPKSGMQNLKPASLNAADSDNDDDGDATIGHSKISASKGNRVDYAETLGQAYDNLQNIIGEDGVQGLTDQTKGLMQQQKVLMNNMKEMEPLLQSAQGFMNQIVGNGGLAGLSKLFDGKLFSSLAPGIADNAIDDKPKKD